ncbi:MAG: hypothetical protein RLY85_1611, partial [Bacteroidota bacterium]
MDSTLHRNFESNKRYIWKLESTVL